MHPGSTDRRTFIKVSGAAAVGTAFAGCLGDGDGSDDRINVGFISGMTGPYSRLSALIEAGVDLAVENINENGGINGLELEVHKRDSELDPSLGVRRTNELARDKDIDLLVGPVASSTALGVMDAVAEHELVFHSGVANARQITGSECTKYNFRFRNHPEMQAPAVIQLMDEADMGSISITYSDYAWGQSVRDHVRDGWEELGGEVLSETGAPLGTDDFSPHLPDIDRDADALVFVYGGSDAVNFLGQAAEFGLREDMQFYTVGAGIDIGDVETVQEVAEGVKGVCYYPQSQNDPLDHEGNIQFWEDYEEVFGDRPSRMSTPDYEFLNAVKQVGDEIEYTGRDDNDALIDALEGFTVDDYSYEFPQGPKRIREEDHQAMLQSYMWEIQDGLPEISSVQSLDFIEENTSIQCEF